MLVVEDGLRPRQNRVPYNKGVGMNSGQEKNRAAFQQSKHELSNRYPPGRFVAFDDGQIVADAASFDELTASLAAIGKDRSDVFVVQAGADYPDEVFILV
jgi:hypothetical protein